MRKGTIVSLDEQSGTGIIVDENQQDISFSIKYSLLKPYPGQQVNFEIVMGSEGLVATRISPSLLQNPSIVLAMG